MPPSTATGGPHGIVLVDKPEGITSNGVGGRVRWTLGTKKVGHAGTLDPMATGLLLFGVGKGTKLLHYLTGSDKRYEATMRFGYATTTDDRTGEMLGEHARVMPAPDEIAREVAALRGHISQRPSSVSAIKVAGQRAYDRVRSGEDVVLDARGVTIHEFIMGAVIMGEENGYPVCDVTVSVHCSAGTYIRALARDIGDALGVGGHLIALRRTHIAGFSVHEACVSLDEVALMPLAQAAGVMMPSEVLSDAWCDDLLHGRFVERTSEQVREPLAICNEAGSLIAVARQGRSKLRATTVFGVD